MTIVDVHTHNMQLEHWGPEYEANWQPVYGVPWTDVTFEAYDAAMGAVDRAIVFGITAQAVGMNTPDDYTARFVGHNPAKYIGFMGLDPAAPDALDRLERGATDLGLRGIKLYPVLAGFDPTDARYSAFFARAQHYGLAVLWHFGATPSKAGRLRNSHPLLLEDVAMRFPDLKMVIAHLGHPWQKDTALVLRKHANVYADVSAQWLRTWEGFNALIGCVEWGVADKLLFGSDYPLWTPAEAMSALRALPARYGGKGLPSLDPDLIEQIIHRDSLALLGIG
ncbi:MAG: amidohydrolase [Chloroflexi bacterium]|nr:amidohydrolase [Chloroflexota bacterium]